MKTYKYIVKKIRTHTKILKSSDGIRYDDIFHIDYPVCYFYIRHLTEFIYHNDCNFDRFTNNSLLAKDNFNEGNIEMFLLKRKGEIDDV